VIFKNETSESPDQLDSAEKANLSSGWGSSIRLAMELLSDEQRNKLATGKVMDCNDVSSTSTNTEKIKTDVVKSDLAVNSESTDEFGTAKEILRALHILVNQESNNLCAQIELLVRFDELEGWRESGSKSCTAWMNAYLQIDQRTAWERLRVGRQIRFLPIIRKLFQQGRLSWSKVRLLTRVATADNESLLAHASMDASVSDVQRLCEEYRWAKDDKESDACRAKMQFEQRTLNWQQLSNGSTQIRIVLPPEQAQNFLHAIEQCEELIYQDMNLEVDSQNNLYKTDSESVNCIAESPSDEKITPSQRRADAAILLAERSIAFCGQHLSPADRFQVVLNIDNDSLARDCENDVASPGVPPRKPMIEGIGSVPIATARKIACDCSVVKLLTEGGEPLSIGRKNRIWAPSMRRAILTRDRHCQFPGCSSHRFLHIHHIKHWIDGGETSIDNGVCLCQYHHQLVHSEHYSIERCTVESTEFETTGFHSSSKKKLLPTRCRFVFKRPNCLSDNKLKERSLNDQESIRGGAMNNSADLMMNSSSCGSADVMSSSKFSSRHGTVQASAIEIRNGCKEEQACYEITSKLARCFGQSIQV